MSKAIANGVVVLAALALLPVVALGQGNVDKGKGLYAQNCAACHGAAGKGDGPAGTALNPKPRDLTDKSYMAGMKDQQIFDLVKKGGAAVGKSPLMPPLGGTLKDADIRDVVAFVRSLAR